MIPTPSRTLVVLIVLGIAWSAGPPDAGLAAPPPGAPPAEDDATAATPTTDPADAPDSTPGAPPGTRPGAASDTASDTAPDTAAKTAADAARDAARSAGAESVPAGSGAAETPPALGSATDAAGPDAAATDAAARPRSDAYRPLGPNLFPLYQHYLRTADDTEVVNLLYLYARTRSRATGGGSLFLFPLFYSADDPEAPSDSLYLFPLLYFQGSTPEASYDYAFPFYFRHDTPEAIFRYAFPFWLRTREGGVTESHVVPPLFRYTTDRSRPGTPEDRSRLGIWKVLELWESRVDAESSAYKALNIFNWKRETESGLSVFSSSWRGEGENAQGSTYLFPLYWNVREGATRFDALLPLWARATEVGQSDLWLPALLSRYGHGKDGAFWLGALFPLFAYGEDKKGYIVYSFPLYSRSVGRPETTLESTLILYHSHVDTETGRQATSFLYPLSRFDNAPDGTSGDNWFFPYIETYDTRKLWRLVIPFWIEYQTLAGNRANVDWFFRLGLPLFLSLGSPEDYFTMGFPLYWGSRTGARGWQVLIPFYVHTFSATSSSTHVFPLVSHRSVPSRKQLFIVGPLYVNERFYGLGRRYQGMGHHVLWPFFAWEGREDGHLYRLLPLFWSSREGDASDLLLTPFYYESDGPQGKRRYFIPFYGRFEAERLSREYYALGTYIRTREVDGEGAPVRSKDDFLWALASSSQEHRTGSSHAHIFPLAYWSTRTPAEDLTIAGPFYFSERSVDGDETEFLDLILGNLIFSRVVERREPAAVGPDGLVPAGQAGEAGSMHQVDDAAAREASEGEEHPIAETGKPPDGGVMPPAGDGSLHPLSRAPAAVRPSREIWRDQGVLWPLARSYRSEDGSRGTWLIPFYFNTASEASRRLAFWPFFYGQADNGPYDINYFRYFFLFDRETWRGGHRWTIGQVVADWTTDEATASHRLRVLYPLVSYAWDPEGYALDVTPLCRFSRSGETVENRFFPIYWQGKTVREGTDGKPSTESSHFFLFPLFGQIRKSTHTEYYAPFPLFHLKTSVDALRFELWPAVFFRDEPALFALRLWPLHADETRVGAGDSWVSRFLFFSKRFETPDGFRYRLDPFIFRISRGPDETGMAALLELLAYDRKGSDASLRLFPFAFGGASATGSSLAVIPFHYRRISRTEPNPYGLHWRLLFPTNYLEGADGERHTSVLGYLFEHTRNPLRPEYGELGFLYRLFFRRTTETSTSFNLNPFYSYYRNETDDETQYSIFLSLYNYRRIGRDSTHTLFWLFRF